MSIDMNNIDPDQPVTYRMLARYHVAQELPNMESISREVVADVNHRRQALEDSRANHRNFNRMLTLVGALLIGLVVTWNLTTINSPMMKALGPHLSKALTPYAFVITVALDASLALYSLIKKY